MRRPHRSRRESFVIIEEQKDSDLYDEADVLSSRFQSLHQQASRLGNRVSTLENIVHLQSALLRQAARYSTMLQSHVYDTSYAVPGEIVIFFVEHGMTVPTAEESGKISTEGIREMLSVLDAYIEALRGDISTNTASLDRARREYDSTMNLLFECSHVSDRRRRVVIYRH